MGYFTYRIGVYWGYNPLIRTVDPNFTSKHPSYNWSDESIGFIGGEIVIHIFHLQPRETSLTVVSKYHGNPHFLHFSWL